MQAVILPCTRSCSRVGDADAVDVVAAYMQHQVRGSAAQQAGPQAGGAPPPAVVVRLVGQTPLAGMRPRAGGEDVACMRLPGGEMCTASASASAPRAGCYHAERQGWRARVSFATIICVRRR